MAHRIQIRRDAAANWVTANPILAEGEPAYEIDTGLEKVGDGITAWNDLPYKSALPTNNRVDLGAATNLDWSIGDTFLSDPLAPSTAFTFSNMPEGIKTQQITHYVTGEQTFSYPAYCTKLAGEYDGTVINQIVFECVNGNAGSEIVYYSIIPLIAD